MNTFRIGALLVGTICSLFTGQSYAVEAHVELSGDRWYYPFNGSPGTRANGSMFNYKYDPNSVEFPFEFKFNYMDGYVITKFAVSLPEGITESYKITSAKLDVWQIAGANWDPSTSVTLFAAGFGPTYTESSWVETSPFVGGNGTTLKPRDPYPRDFIDDSHVEDNSTTATQWATAIYPDYTVAAGNSEPFKMTYHLDVENPKIRQELKDDFLSGFSSWILGSSIVQGDHGSTSYPDIYLRATPAWVPPAPIEFPKLTIEVEPTSNVEDWIFY